MENSEEWRASPKPKKPLKERLDSLSNKINSVAVHKITPERDKEDYQLKPTDAGYKWFSCPTCDGTAKISQDQLNEMNNLQWPSKLELPNNSEILEKQIQSLRDQLEKQEVAFRETVKIQGEEIQRLKNRLKELGDIDN